MERECCAGCGRSTIVRGQISAVSHETGANFFVPNHLRLFRSRPGVPFPGGEIRSCLSCGLLWTIIDPAKLREFIGEFGDELGRQYLDEIDRGPMRDLPDTAIAHEIGEKIAKLDAMARARKVGIVGLYREMSGVTWDEAIKAVGKWTQLTREEKLALLGWQPKKKEPVDEFF